MSGPGVPQQVPEVGAAEADDLVRAGALLLDVREPDEWEAGHAPAARSIPLGQLAERLAEIPDGTIVVVCRSGGRSARAAAALAGSGREARNLAGGMQAWAAAGLPVVTDAGGPGTVA
ncbi:MAG TPA: rhodanese-like domain-containing protein [Acidimicrobiales bacterium]|nr:rhodanese-like domain-containing protein [Acidimicrobiales bacterium]